MNATITYSYDNAPNVGTVTYPYGVESTFTYDTLNRVTGLSLQPASYTYQRGPTGNLLSATESGGRQVNWSYDGIYRLTNETISLDLSKKNGSVTYQLDPVGNCLNESSRISGLSLGAWTFNANDELSNETYDQNGNVLTTGGKTFTYNSQNQLVSMNGMPSRSSMTPERVADDGNSRCVQYGVLRNKPAAKFRHHLKNAKKVRRDTKIFERNSLIDFDQICATRYVVVNSSGRKCPIISPSEPVYDLWTGCGE